MAAVSGKAEAGVQEASVPEREQQVREATIENAVSTLLGAISVIALAAADGGYFPTAWSWSALLFLWLSASALFLRSSLRLGRTAVASLAALTAFLAWVLASAAWSPSPGTAVAEGERALAYAAALLAALLVVRAGGVRPLLTGVWAGITLVSLYALVTRLLPGRPWAFDSFSAYRLEEPLGYWNALGLFAALGALLAVGLAARNGGTIARALPAASLVVLAPTAYFTFSRGAWLALLVGLLAAVALDPRRLQLVASLLVVAPWPALAVLAASRSPALTRLGSSLEDAAGEGGRLALVLVALAAASVAATAAFVRAERTVRVGRPVRAVFSAALVGVVVAGSVATFVHYGSPSALFDRVQAGFEASPSPAPKNLNARLFRLSGTWRGDLWRVAWHDFERDRWLGRGAGTYEASWLRERQIPLKVRDAHNLYLETLGELGAAGLALLAVALALPVAAAVRARAHPLAATALAAYAAFLAHAAVDWDWEMPAVTVPALLCAGGLLLLSGEREQSVRVSGAFRGVLLVVVLAAAAAAFVGLIGNAALSSAGAALAADRAGDAASDAREATRWAPWSPEPWQLLGEAELSRGDRRAARAAFRRALDKDSSSWELWFHLALASKGKERREAAARALRLNPRSPELAEAGLAGAGP
ncbi:MAG: O-antigen ligase family protein [Thermoleophilia bacterium]|nr:O-antigen ligase family protein [Thermoleophilia bacterium]